MSVTKVEQEEMNSKARPIRQLSAAAKATNATRISNLLKNLFLVLMVAVSLYPILWMISSSFKAPEDVFTPTASLIPETVVLTNFRDAWNKAPFGIFLKNSIQISLITVGMQLLTTSMAAYGFAKVKFWGHKALFTLVLVGMMIPTEAAIIPNYIFVNDLNLRNTPLGIAVVSLTSIFSIFLLRQHMRGIPNALLESVEIDGGGEFHKFFFIVLPNVKSSLATVAILSFMSSWNDYMWPYLMSDIESARTVQIGLKYLIDPDLGPEWPMLMAAATMVTLPILVLYVSMQRYFIEGMTSSGIK